MGNNGDDITNDEGQYIPEGVPTKNETALTRDIFSELYKFFPESFSTKDDSVIPESYELFDINK